MNDRTAFASPGDDNVSPLVAKPTHSYVNVTPDMARRWLLRNSANRNLRAAKINQYARDMEAGRWTLSNDDICFAPDGTLLNGQHRLNAVIKSGRTVLMGIKRNVPPAARQNMDSGASRTPADVLRFAGEAHASLLGSALKQAILIETGRIYQDTNTHAVSRGEQVEFLAAHPELRGSVALVGRIKQNIDAPPTALAIAHWLITLTNGSDLADLYINQLAKRVGEPEGSAVHAVDSRLREVRRNRNSYSTRYFVYLLIKGWNYYAAGKAVTKLQMAPKGEFRLPTVARWSR